jgi:nucleotide-binding universal stress UspA family protein
MSKKVLVPLDSSELAECALSHVRDLAKYGIAGEVTLLNVIQVNIPWAEGYGERFEMRTLRDKSLAASLSYLAGLEAGLSGAGIKVKTDSIEAHSVPGAITEYAQKNGMDMILIATNGYSGLKKMVLGSVAAGVLQQSNVPVYLIRPDACRV